MYNAACMMLGKGGEELIGMHYPYMHLGYDAKGNGDEWFTPLLLPGWYGCLTVPISNLGEPWAAVNHNAHF